MLEAILLLVLHPSLEPILILVLISSLVLIPSNSGADISADSVPVPALLTPGIVSSIGSLSCVLDVSETTSEKFMKPYRRSSNETHT